MNSKRSRRSSNQGLSDELNDKKVKTRKQCKTTKSSTKTSYDNCRKSSRSKCATANVSSISDPTEASLSDTGKCNMIEVLNKVKVDKSKVGNSYRTDLCSSTADTSNPSAMLMSRLGENVNESENFFEHLPFMITENIISRLSFRELMKARSVCKSWNETIGNPNFLKWRKTYYEMKFKHNTMDDFLHTVFPSTNERESCENIFIDSLRFMANDFPRKPPSSLGSLLCKMSICVTAKRFLLEKFPNEQALAMHPWCVLTISIILSQCTGRLYNLLECVMNNYNYNDILETMYCIASILLHLATKFRINHRLHYQLYYIIHLLENRSPVSLTYLPEESELPKQELLNQLSQSLTPELTYEQLAILNHNLGPNQVVKIDGVAGAGKTSVLAEFAKKHSNLKFLYLAHRELVCKNSASCFPSNVVCKTLRSLAYDAVGKSYNHKLCCEIGVSDIQPFVHKKECFANFMHDYRKSILFTIKKFCQSADETLTVSHAVLCDLGLINELDVCDEFDPATTTAKEFVCSAVFNDAKMMWEKIISKDDKQCKITSGIYLKLFHLSRPVLSGYDCILVDEAEDFYSVALDIIFSQKLPVILAGDSNQQLEVFLHLQNPWSRMAATHTYHLRKSFRFGPEIAYVANCCTEYLTQSTKTTLVGTLQDSYIDGTIKGKYAVIAASPAKLFLEAARLCCSNERRRHEPRDICGTFLGGIENSGFNQLVDMYRLKSYVDRHDITDAFVKSFSHYSELTAYVYRAKRNLIVLIDVVEGLQERILIYFNLIKTMCSYDLTEANVVFSLAQNAKGFEFDTVLLVDNFGLENIWRGNFYYLEMENPSLESESRQEILNNGHNTLYTAITRAKKCLIICEYAYKSIVETQETFEYAVDSSLLFRNSPSLECSRCSCEFEPPTALTVIRKSMILSSGKQIRSGPLCRNCMTQKYSQINKDLIYNMYNYGPYRLACFLGVLRETRLIEEVITIDDD